MKISKRSIYVIVTIIIFALLSYIKLSTIQLTFKTDPTIVIVKTESVQFVGNFIRVDIENIKDDFYNNKGYKILYSTESIGLINKIYTICITLWWVVLIIISVIIISKGILRLLLIPNNY